MSILENNKEKFDTKMFIILEVLDIVNKIDNSSNILVRIFYNLQKY